MDELRGGILGEIATEAGIERASFLSDAGKQFTQFMEANRERIKELGGMVLIDEDPDYLSVAEDGTFRSRSRYQDETTGEWISETEVIESAAELIELYNPAEIYAVFAEAARDEAGLPEQPTAAEDLLETEGVPAVSDVRRLPHKLGREQSGFRGAKLAQRRPQNGTETIHRRTDRRYLEGSGGGCKDA